MMVQPAIGPSWGILVIAALIVIGIVFVVRAHPAVFAVIFLGLVLLAIPVMALFWFRAVQVDVARDFGGPGAVSAVRISPSRTVISRPPRFERPVLQEVPAMEPDTATAVEEAKEPESMKDETASAEVAEASEGNVVAEAPPSEAKKSQGILAALGRAITDALNGTPAPTAKPQAVVKANTKPAASAAKKPAPVTKVEPPPAEKPAVKPAWVNAEPQTLGGVSFVTLHVGPYTSRGECDAEMPQALRAAVTDYLRQNFGAEAARQTPFSVDDLRGKLVRDECEEIMPLKVGDTIHDMTQVHLRLAFDSQLYQQLRARWDECRVHLRMAKTGLALGGLLGLLGIAFGYLKVDITTAGQYRGWLRLGAAGLLVAIVGLIAMIA